eukprot:3079616-Amphidinium_carterae.1
MACDAFRATIGAAGPDEFERPGLDGRTIFMSTLQTGRRRARWVGSGDARSSLPAVQEEKNRGRVLGVPGIASIGSDLAVEHENAFDEPGFSKDNYDAGRW